MKVVLGLGSLTAGARPPGSQRAHSSRWPERGRNEYETYPSGPAPRCGGRHPAADSVVGASEQDGLRDSGGASRRSSARSPPFRKIRRRRKDEKGKSRSLMGELMGLRRISLVTVPVSDQERAK